MKIFRRISEALVVPEDPPHTSVDPQRSQQQKEFKALLDTFDDAALKIIVSGLQIASHDRIDKLNRKKELLPTHRLLQRIKVAKALKSTHNALYQLEAQGAESGIKEIITAEFQDNMTDLKWMSDQYQLYQEQARPASSEMDSLPALDQPPSEPSPREQ